MKPSTRACQGRITDHPLQAPGFAIVDGDNGSITLDLGTTQQLGGVEFLTRSMADGTSITDTDTYTVTVDDTDALGPFPAGTVADPRPSELDTTGRRLRFDVETSTGGNVGAVEIRVYGPDA